MEHKTPKEEILFYIIHFILPATIRIEKYFFSFADNFFDIQRHSLENLYLLVLRRIFYDEISSLGDLIIFLFLRFISENHSQISIFVRDKITKQHKKLWLRICDTIVQKCSFFCHEVIYSSFSFFYIHDWLREKYSLRSS